MSLPEYIHISNCLKTFFCVSHSYIIGNSLNNFIIFIHKPMPLPGSFYHLSGLLFITVAYIKVKHCYSEFPNFYFKTQQFWSFKRLHLLFFPLPKGAYFLFKRKTVCLNFVKLCSWDVLKFPSNNSYQISLKIKEPLRLHSAEQQKAKVWV